MPVTRFANQARSASVCALGTIIVFMHLVGVFTCSRSHFSLCVQSRVAMAPYDAPKPPSVPRPAAAETILRVLSRQWQPLALLVLIGACVASLRFNSTTSAAMDQVWQRALISAEEQLQLHPWPFLCAVVAVAAGGVVGLAILITVGLLMINFTGDLALLLLYGKNCLCGSATATKRSVVSVAARNSRGRREPLTHRKVTRTASDPQLAGSAVSARQ